LRSVEKPASFFYFFSTHGSVSHTPSVYITSLSQKTAFSAVQNIKQVFLVGFVCSMGTLESVPFVFLAKLFNLCL